MFGQSPGPSSRLALSLCFGQLVVALSLLDLALQGRDRVERVNPVLSFFSFLRSRGVAGGSHREPHYFQALLVVLVRLGMACRHDLETTLNSRLVMSWKIPKTSYNC